MTFPVLRRGVPVLALMLVLALGACSKNPEGSVSPTPSTSTTDSLSAAPTVPPCPNPEGGSCLGPLHAGQKYRTVKFEPTLTYEVPSEGWNNFEDLYGNFLLVPPGVDLEGVNAGTSDYIGVYRAVLPSTLTSPTCGVSWPLGSASGPTPQEMVNYYRKQRSLAVSNVHGVEVGGRTGVELDLQATPGVPLDHCTDGATDVEINQVISGVDGSSFDHGVIRDMTMRLYLLQDDGRVMGIEITDIHAAPATADDMSRTVESLRFGG